MCACYPELYLFLHAKKRRQKREKKRGERRTSFQHRGETPQKYPETPQIHCGVGGVGWLGGWLRRRHLRQAGCLKPSGQATKKKKRKKKKKKQKKKGPPRTKKEERNKANTFTPRPKGPSAKNNSKTTSCQGLKQGGFSIENLSRRKHKHKPTEQHILLPIDVKARQRDLRGRPFL